MQSVQDVIMNFIEENFIVGRTDKKLDLEESLLESGIIDSTGVLELVLFLEENYSIKIEDEELIPENLDSINNIIKFLKMKGVN